jgi:hypothetical protein
MTFYTVVQEIGEHNNFDKIVKYRQIINAMYYQRINRIVLSNLLSSSNTRHYDLSVQEKCFSGSISKCTMGCKSLCKYVKIALQIIEGISIY